MLKLPLVMAFCISCLATPAFADGSESTEQKIDTAPADAQETKSTQSTTDATSAKPAAKATAKRASKPAGSARSTT